jgi:uncharacterized protein YjbI with pentapeptide repeats
MNVALQILYLLTLIGAAQAFRITFLGNPNHHRTVCSVSNQLRETPNATNASVRLPLLDFRNFVVSFVLVASLSVGVLPIQSAGAFDELGGATSGANAKITTGGASTLQSGRTIAITRGVNLDRADFKGQNLKGVAFQQSIVRDADFRGSNLVGASFFDATVDGSNFEGADLSFANFEMAQFNRANLKNAVLKEMYVSGSTLFEG